MTLGATVRSLPGSVTASRPPQVMACMVTGLAIPFSIRWIRVAYERPWIPRRLQNRVELLLTGYVRGVDGENLPDRACHTAVEHGGQICEFVSFGDEMRDLSGMAAQKAQGKSEIMWPSATVGK